MSTAGITLSGTELISPLPDFDATGSSTWAPPVKKRSAVARPQTTETVFAAESDSATEWLPAQLAKLIRMRSLSASWHSSNAAPPNALAIETATKVLRHLAEMDFGPSFIAPSSDEGVCISFESGAKYADIECFNTGEVLAMTSPQIGKPTIWDAQHNIQDAIAKIIHFIAD